MNGLKVFLENYDPAKINNDLLYILQMYSKDTNKISNFFRKLWVKKVSYPLLRRKIDKINTYAINLIIKNPETFVMVIARYLCYLTNHCKIFRTSFEKLTQLMFGKDIFKINMELEEITQGLQVKSFNLVVQCNIPLPIELETKEEKFAITTLDADMENRIFNISQIAYDTTKKEEYHTSRILYDKKFELRGDMKLHNPNYVLDRNLKQEDKKFFVFMICHIMLIFGQFLDGTTMINMDATANDPENKDKEEV